MNKRHDITFRDRKQTDSKEYARCPVCGHVMSRVMTTSSATYNGLNGVGRERKCHGCNHRWRTIELTADAIDDYGSMIGPALAEAHKKLRRIENVLREECPGPQAHDASGQAE